MSNKKPIYNILTNLLLQLVKIIYGFVFPLIIINYFGSKVNGLVSSIAQFLAYITLLESGFGPVVKSILYKPIAKNDDETISKILYSSEKFFRKISLFFILYIVFLCFIYPLFIDSSFSILYTVSLIIIISISTFAEYFFGMTYNLFLQAEQKNYIISSIHIISYVLSIALVLILAYLNCNIHIIRLASGLVFAIKPLFLNYYVKRKYNIKFNNSNYEIKQKWDGLAQHIAGVIHGNTDITLITFFCKLTEVSVYAVYSLITKAINQLMLSLRNGIDSLFGDLIAKNDNKGLCRKFDFYEVIYLSFVTLFCSCAIVLITPFVSLYTNGVKDVNYTRYLFGYLIVSAEFITSIKEIYHDLVKSGGRFKETKNGAWLECIINMTLSILLISRFGLVGVVIGTIVSTFIRLLELVIYSNKNILKRNFAISIKKIAFFSLETVLIIFISKYIVFFNYNSYIGWILNSIVLFLCSIFMIVLFDLIFYRKIIIYYISILFKKNKEVK